MKKMYYLAYGSNLHPLRLTERVPSAELLAVVEHTHHQLGFHKKSHDGSGKCNIFNTAVQSDRIYGAIYKLAPEHKTDLDRFEGKGNGYIDQQIAVKHDGKQYSCFTYRAQPSHIVDNLMPYHWYKSLVILGAEYLQFPETYISSIKSIDSLEDPDEKRRKQMQDLIARMIKFQ